VKRFWRRRGGAELESRLERRREPARPEFVNQLAGELRSTGRRRLAPVRLLLAAALTLGLLVAVASVGGVASGGVVRDQVVSAVKSVNKKVTAKRGSSWRNADADDDDNGGGGGGGDDDDDDNGGGGGGDDDDDNGDDDDDGDDDQYEEDEEECFEALRQQTRAFHRTQAQQHQAFHRQRPQPSKAAHEAFHDQQEADRHTFNANRQQARDECDEIDGDDDHDDDDDGGGDGDD
jgi:hypothetical protein